MAFGKQLVYQDFHSEGVGNNRYFAEDINDFIMAMQGNYVISGCDASVGGTTDLTSAGTHVVIAAGSAFVNGAVRTIGAANVDLSTAFNALGTGQSRLVLIYINSSGVVATISGDIVTDGNQLPELSSTGWTPDDTTPIAWIYLTEADSTMNLNQIYDDIIYAPKGAYFDGDVYLPDNKKSYWGDGGDLSIYHDATNSIIENINGEFHIDNSFSHINLRTVSRIRIKDIDDSNATLFQLDTSARTLAIGTSADEISTTINGDLIIIPDPVDHLGSFQFIQGTGTVNKFIPHIKAFNDSDGVGDKIGLVIQADMDSDIVNASSPAMEFRVSQSNSAFATKNLMFQFSNLNTDLLTMSRSGAITNPLDNAGFYTGAGDDLRIYHDSTNSYVLNNTGSLILRNDVASTHLYLQSKEKIIFSDIDDSFVSLLELDTTARTLDIGASADPIVTTVYGNILVGADSTYDIGTTSVRFRAGYFDDVYSSTLKLLSGSGGVLTIAYAATVNNRSYTIGETASATNIALYNTTTTTGSADVIVQSNATGLIRQTTSSRRFKDDLRDIKDESELFYSMNVYNYYSIPDDKRFYGLVAEEVADKYPILAKYEEDGKTIQNYDTRGLIAIHILETQRLEKRVRELEQIITQV